MAARFVKTDHDTPLLIPPDLHCLVPADHMVHFIMNAVAALDLPTHESMTAAPAPPGISPA